MDLNEAKEVVMATYTKQENGKIKARVRWDGKQKSKNFDDEQEARAWVRAIDRDLGVLNDRRHALTHFQPDAFDRGGLYVPVNMSKLHGNIFCSGHVGPSTKPI
jgi:hypothetical protein